MLRDWRLNRNLWIIRWRGIGFFIQFWLFTKERVKRLRYSDICKAFYISEEIGNGETQLIGIGIKSAESQADIASYFLALGGDNAYQELIAQYNPSTFNKWFYGTTGQRKEIWERFKDSGYNEDKYVELLQADLDEDILPRVAINLGITIRNGEKINKNRLAIAIARQMCELAKGKVKDRSAANLIPDIYNAGKIECDFADYIKKSIARYNVMKLIGGSEVPLEDYFVCNTLGDKQRVITDRAKLKSECLEDDAVTIENIRNMYLKRRGFDNRKSILIGCGGSGKTLMLQHLFLDGLNKFPETGILPIFIELRYFTENDEIEPYIFKNVSSKDPSFTEDICRQMLIDGRCPLLMDGLDEIDPSHINGFHKKLNDFTDKYDRNQVILASRECDAITGLNGYVKLYVWPFDPGQSEKLVDKILAVSGEQQKKTTIMDYINNGFIRKDGAFSSHPMLLTFVAMNYPQYKSFNGNHLLFYKKAYEALLTGHDDNKKPYDRVFHSVDGPDQFSKVFREFCGKTYKDGMVSFDDETFLKYFESLTSYKKFENTSKMTLKKFKHDVCSTACMMYEKDLGLWYIDPGFQEFLFVEYYSTTDTEETKDLGVTLMGKPYSDYASLDAFEMLYESEPTKVDVCIFLPFLNEIFKSEYSEQDSFRIFLANGYENLSFCSIDNDAVEKYKKNDESSRTLEINNINEPGTVVLTWLLNKLGISPIFTISTTKSNPEWDMYAKRVLAGEYAGINGKQDSLMLRGYLKSQFDDKDYFIRVNKTDQLIKDDKGNFVCFGLDYEIDTLDIEDEPEKFNILIEEMMDDSCGAYLAFKALKNYHKKLKREQRRNRLR